MRTPKVDVLLGLSIGGAFAIFGAIVVGTDPDGFSPPGVALIVLVSIVSSIIGIYLSRWVRRNFIDKK